MASNLPSFSEELMCPVCFEKYDNDNRRPKVLPCQHTFCFLCLHQISHAHFGALKCPSCNKQYDNINIGLLKDNFTVKSIMATMESSTAGTSNPGSSHDHCVTHTSCMITHACCDCQQFMCPKCLAEASMGAQHTDHKIIDIDEALEYITAEVNETETEWKASMNAWKVATDKKQASYYMQANALKEEIDNKAQAGIAKINKWKADAYKEIDEKLTCHKDMFDIHQPWRPTCLVKDEGMQILNDAWLSKKEKLSKWWEMRSSNTANGALPIPPDLKVNGKVDIRVILEDQKSTVGQQSGCQNTSSTILISEFPSLHPTGKVEIQDFLNIGVNTNGVWLVKKQGNRGLSLHSLQNTGSQGPTLSHVWDRHLPWASTELESTLNASDVNYYILEDGNILASNRWSTTVLDTSSSDKGLTHVDHRPHDRNTCRSLMNIISRNRVVYSYYEQRIRKISLIVYNKEHTSNQTIALPVRIDGAQNKSERLFCECREFQGYLIQDASNHNIVLVDKKNLVIDIFSDTFTHIHQVNARPNQPMKRKIGSSNLSTQEFFSKINDVNQICCYNDIIYTFRKKQSPGYTELQLYSWKDNQCVQSYTLTDIDKTGCLTNISCAADGQLLLLESTKGSYQARQTPVKQKLHLYQIN